MEDYMLTAQWDFWTEKILPWYKTDDLSVQWTKWENNPHYMGITPHQATSRVVTQRRTIRKASIVRRGIAMEFENDFVKTPLGRTSFMASLAQMSRSVQETANVEVLRALINCHRYQQKFQRDFGVIAKGDLDGWLDRQAARFMIAQKTINGLEIVSTQIDADQEQYKGKANVWILGREVSDYVRFRPEKSLYYLGGQQAVDRVNGRNKITSDAIGNTMGNVRSMEPAGFIDGLPVYLAKSAFVDSVGRLELLSRTVEKGVYNMMVDRTKDYSKYRTEGRNLRVYDNDIDSWSVVELHTAIWNCGVWDPKDGSIRKIYNQGKGGRGGNMEAHADKEYDFLSFGSGNSRTELEYIGDMGMQYLHAGNLHHAAQTMLNALTDNDPAQLKELTTTINGFIAKRSLLVDGLPEYADLQGAEKATIDDLGTRILNLVGPDNLFFERSINTPGRVLWENFVVYGLIPGERIYNNGEFEPLASGINQHAEAIATDESKFLLQLLGAAVHDSHKDQLAKIANQTTQPWLQRAAAIKNIVLECVRAKPDPEGLKNSADVDQWYNTKVAAFKNRLQKNYGVGKTTGAESVQGEVRYFTSAVPKGFKQLPAKPLFSQIGTHVVPGARGEVDERAISAKEQRGRNNTTTVEGLDRDTRYNNVRAHIEALAKTSASPVIKWLGSIYAATHFDRERFCSFALNHIYVPLGFLLMRQHCTYKTRFGIKMQMGFETGATFFGHSDMQIEHEAARKVGMAHYTTYLSAVVFEPNNVYVQEDLFCQKYLGGMGVEFWQADHYKASNNRRAKSIICAPLPPNFKKIEQKIDGRGRWYTEMRLGLVTQERYDQPLYPGAGRINYLFGFADEARSTKQSNTRKTGVNFVMWQGVEFYYNTTTNSWDDYTVESGSFGPWVYPGCGQVRNGHAMYLEKPDYIK